MFAMGQEIKIILFQKIKKINVLLPCDPAVALSAVCPR